MIEQGFFWGIGLILAFGAGILFLFVVSLITMFIVYLLDRIGKRKEK